MQGLRLKFGERRNDWRCCFCCHVRTGTICIGIWNVVMHILALALMAILLRDPQAWIEDLDPVLPTPQSEVDPHMKSMSSDAVFDLDRTYMSPQISLPHNLRLLTDLVSVIYEYINIGVVIAFCSFAMTLLLLYGAIKGKPSYLMPFFCLQVFDFCLLSLFAVGFLCYPPDIRLIMTRSDQNWPFKDKMLSLHPQILNLLAVVVLLGYITIKAYCIGILWSCYKYLTLRKVAAQRTVQFIDPDVQNLLPDLPDYETAVKKYPTPPPSYSSAMQGQQCPVLVDVNNCGSYSAQPLSAQNIMVPTPLTSGATSQCHSANQISTPQQV